MLLSLIVNIAKWLVSGILAYYFVRSHLGMQRRKLFGLCLTYVVLLGMFGHIYHYLYLKDHHMFAFSADVSDTRRTELAETRTREIERLTVVLRALNQLPSEIATAKAVVSVNSHDDNAVEVETTEFHFDLDFDQGWSGERSGTLFRRGRLVVADKMRTRVLAVGISYDGPNVALQKTLPRQQWNRLIESFFQPNIADKADEILAPLRLQFEKNFQALKSEEDANKRDRIEQWTYLDCFYFSAITQTTVGYGDILPNRSVVRMFVVGQVLAGLVLLGVGISWFTAEERSKDSPD